jgi:hypothetical protein
MPSNLRCIQFLNVHFRELLEWCTLSRAIAQEVSSWLPTAAARVRARDWSCGICGRHSGAGAGFLWVPRFPLPNFIPPTAPQSPSSIIWGWYNRPVVAAVPSGLSLTPLIIIIIKNGAHSSNLRRLSILQREKCIKFKSYIRINIYIHDLLLKLTKEQTKGLRCRQ